MREPELSGISIVAVGAFNPAIFHPQWLSDKGLIAANAAEHAMNPDQPQPMIVSTDVTAFVADWLSVQVAQEQAVFSTVDRAREHDLRDLVAGVFELLPESPVGAVGLNSDTHFRLEDQDAWHAFGDKFLPKEFWEPVFEVGGDWTTRTGGAHVGMRSMTVEVTRADETLPGFVRIELAPSRRITPHGVFVGINGHFQLAKSPDARTSASDAARVLAQNWDETRKLEDHVVSQILEAV